ncbi:MAG: DUF4339 domain-containing protein [Rhizobiales bacterium]|nr:DUF4339 domain-containing protein [Hyphomicrobiales bacterium]
MTDALWYYADATQPKGPLSLDELVSALKRQTQPENVLVWSDGFNDWVSASEVSAIRRRLVTPPPLPRREPVARASVPTAVSECASTAKIPAPAAPEISERKEFVSPLSSEYARASVAENQKSSWMGWGASVGGGLIGLGLSKALGGAFWIPALCILLAHWALTKTRAPAPIVLMLSVLVGHTLWMGVGHISLILLDKQSPDLALFAIDVLAVLILTVWSVKRPSVIACLMVLVYQGVSAATVILEFEQISRVSAVAAFMHCVLRALGICLAIYAAVKIRHAHELDGVEDRRSL